MWYNYQPHNRYKIGSCGNKIPLKEGSIFERYTMLLFFFFYQAVVSCWHKSTAAAGLRATCITRLQTLSRWCDKLPATVKSQFSCWDVCVSWSPGCSWTNKSWWWWSVVAYYCLQIKRVLSLKSYVWAEYRRAVQHPTLGPSTASQPCWYSGQQHFLSCETIISYACFIIISSPLSVWGCLPLDPPLAKVRIWSFCFLLSELSLPPTQDR